MEKVKKDTVARTVVLALALLNQALAIAGREALPFGEDQVYQLVSLTLTLVASLVSWWKNNSFTKAAIAGDNYLKLFRKADKILKEANKQCA